MTLIIKLPQVLSLWWPSGYSARREILGGPAGLGSNSRGFTNSYCNTRVPSTRFDKHDFPSKIWSNRVTQVILNKGVQMDTHV